MTLNPNLKVGENEMKTFEAKLIASLSCWDSPFGQVTPSVQGRTSPEKSGH